jgi:hypothetical protein
MIESNTETPSVFRVGVHLIILVGLFTGFLLAIGVADGRARGNWTPFAVLAGVTAVWFLLLAYLRLEIRPDGFSYRNLSVNRALPFAAVERAFFLTIRSSRTPQGVAAFWVQPRDGKPFKINLRTFPIRAAAVLFAAFDRHGIPVEVPDTWSARRMAAQIRAEQKKLESR